MPAQNDLNKILSYLLRLGLTGFGGPVALVGYMERDLVEREKLIAPDEFKLGLALANAAPGPLAGQLAMWIGYLKGGAWGALLAGLAFVGPPVLLVIGLSVLYVEFQGLWRLHSFMKGMAPAVLVIMMLASIRLARRTLGRRKLLWVIFGTLLVITAVFKTEIGYAFLAAGLLVMLAYAPVGKKATRVAEMTKAANIKIKEKILLSFLALAALIALIASPLFLFFAKAGAFVFGTGMAILPFLYKGLVEDQAWLTAQQFMDAVAVGSITPGPIMVATAFIGYLIKGLGGALIAPLGVFTPVYFFTVLPAPYFKRYQNNPQLKAFVDGVTAAAIGALAGAVLILIPKTLPDFKSLAIFLAALPILTKSKIPDPLIVLAAGFFGLVIF